MAEHLSGSTKYRREIQTTTSNISCIRYHSCRFVLYPCKRVSFQSASTLLWTKNGGTCRIMYLFVYNYCILVSVKS